MMLQAIYRIFKRTKIAIWEIDLLSDVINQLPPELSLLFKKQVEDGLLKRIIVDASDIPGYNAFTFNPKIFNKYHKDNEQAYKLTNIKITDASSNKNLLFTLYISQGVINGYSIEPPVKNDVYAQAIDASDFKKIIIESLDFNEIASIFDSNEKLLINPNDVYKVSLNNKTYYHVKDLEDGDFIGIDINKNVFHITHDPFEIILLNKSLSDVLKNLKKLSS